MHYDHWGEGTGTVPARVRLKGIELHPHRGVMNHCR